MANPIKRLVQLVLDRDAARRTETEARRSLGGVQRGLGALKRAAVAVGAALLAAFSIRAIGRFANAVDESRRTLIRLTGASGAALRQLQGDVRAVFRTVPEAIGDVAVAAGNLNTLLGVVGPQLQTVTKASLDFARANAVDVAQASLLVGQLINRYGLEAQAAVPFMDRLTVAGQRTGASVVGLATNLSNVGPVLTAMGFSINEQIALFAEFEKRGINASEAAMGMQRVFTNLAKEGFTDATAAFQEFLRRIREAPSDLQAGAIAAEAFGSRAGGKMALDIRAGAFEIDDMVRALEEADGALARTEEESRTAADAFKTATNQLKATLIPAFELATRIATGLVGGLGLLVRGLQKVGDVINVAVLGAISNGVEAFALLQKGIAQVGIAAATVIERLGGPAGLSAAIRDNAEAMDELADARIRAARALRETARENLFDIFRGGAPEAPGAAADGSAFSTVPGGGEGGGGAGLPDTDAVDAVKDAFEKHAEALKAIRTQAALLGKDYDATEAEAALLKSTIQALATAGVAPDDSRLIEFRDRMRELEAEIKARPPLKLELSPVNQALADFNERLEVSNTLASVLGSDFDELAERTHAITAAMRTLAEQGLDATDPKMQALAQRMREVQDEGQRLQQELETTAQIAGIAGDLTAAAFGSGIGPLAAAKAKQNAVLAAEQLALGFAATIGVISAPLAGAHFAAAAKFSAIAAAWGSLAGATGGFSGASAGGTAGRGAGVGASERSERPGAEVHIYLDPLSPADPRFQRVVAGATRNAEETYGPNATVRVHRRNRSPA